MPAVRELLLRVQVDHGRDRFWHPGFLIEHRRQWAALRCPWLFPLDTRRPLPSVASIPGKRVRALPPRVVPASRSVTPGDFFFFQLSVWLRWGRRYPLLVQLARPYT